MSKKTKRLKEQKQTVHHTQQVASKPAKVTSHSSPNNALDPSQVLPQVYNVFIGLDWEAVITWAQRLGGPGQLSDPSWRKLVAEAHFRQSLSYLQRERLRVHDAVLGREIARLYAEIDLASDAREAWERVLAVAPNDKEARNFLAESLFSEAFTHLDTSRGRATASKLLQRAVELNDAEPRVWAAFAVLHFQEQYEDEAQQCLNKALELIDSPLKAGRVEPF